jgi:hypothetical protein
VDKALPIAANDQSFAAIAVELHIGQNKLSELSFAAAILCMMRQDNLYNLERVAIECGISSLIARDIILDEQRFVGLIAEAHRLFKAMIPHEREMLQLIERGAA